MVAEATARNSSPPPSTSVRFELYDGSVFPFGDEEFDRLFTVNTIYFWEDPAHTLSEVHRVLKPGGRAPTTRASNRYLLRSPSTPRCYRRPGVRSAFSIFRAVCHAWDRAQGQLNSLKSRFVVLTLDRLVRVLFSSKKSGPVAIVYRLSQISKPRSGSGMRAITGPK